jgi:hypothetical protein
MIHLKLYTVGRGDRESTAVREFNREVFMRPDLDAEPIDWLIKGQVPEELKLRCVIR